MKTSEIVNETNKYVESLISDLGIMFSGMLAERGLPLFTGMFEFCGSFTVKKDELANKKLIKERMLEALKDTKTFTDGLIKKFEDKNNVT